MRKKLKRFAENAQRSNIIEPGKAIYTNIKGQWNTAYFGNTSDLVVELACGKGAYTLGLAQMFSNKNFVGVDIKGARLWTGSTQAITEKLSNVVFLRARIEELDSFFAAKEISTLYIPFPDPHPRSRDAKRRLTSPRFWALYRQLLQPDGQVHFKTDNDALFEYTLQVLQAERIKNLTYTRDLYASPLLAEHHGIQTAYEQQFLAQDIKISYLRFAFR
ncbi:MAG: tRNA (guanosine(46)-N7)-methyltransferase TrmB [Bacteroidota bacterium]